MAAELPLLDVTDRASPPPRHFAELVAHLVRRELASTHRMTVLGWLWPLARQLAQLVVLVFVFSRVLRLGIEDYPTFVLSGLVVWSWFQTGVGRAASSLASNRHFVFQSRFPVAVVPVVAIAVPLVDVLFALPVLLVLVMSGPGLTATALLLPFVILVQLVLMAGLAWLLAAAAVFFGDVPNLVGLVTLLLFYLTPVFYGREVIPERYEWILQLNPIAVLIEVLRAIMLGREWPPWGAVTGLCVVSVIACVAGYLLIRRLEPRFVDHL
jgi:lipopolysaccharide transport system permease protein